MLKQRPAAQLEFLIKLIRRMIESDGEISLERILLLQNRCQPPEPGCRSGRRQEGQPGRQESRSKGGR